MQNQEKVSFKKMSGKHGYRQCSLHDCEESTASWSSSCCCVNCVQHANLTCLLVVKKIRSRLSCSQQHRQQSHVSSSPRSCSHFFCRRKKRNFFKDFQQLTSFSQTMFFKSCVIFLLLLLSSSIKPSSCLPHDLANTSSSQLSIPSTIHGVVSNGHRQVMCRCSCLLLHFSLHHNVLFLLFNACHNPFHVYFRVLTLERETLGSSVSFTTSF